ncbi:uncharacterized protein PRCAT00000125001 [Priceomyces carsonii]|uniref:uncharacterized protein n=1 Tax=Priceomyces carsonii TaxID=28549 RepID=UPI002ED8F716|nr:unnamed protein product [Priceomyces carsonii]
MSVSLPSPIFKVGLTPDEKKLYSQLFKALDTESTGIITGDKARSTFEKSGLPPTILGEIWQLADQNNLGFLTQFGFCYAMRLIGYTQAGNHPTAELADYPGPLPKFANAIAPLTGSLQPQSTSSSFMQSQPSSIIPQNTTTLQSQPQGSIKSVNPSDIQKFGDLFIKTVGSSQGKLDGSKARDIFLKAKLPTYTLGQIWSLVDRDNSGHLDLGAFVIAMYLIQGLLGGTIKQLPPFLPESLWQSVQLSNTFSDKSPGSRQTSYGSVNSQQTTIRRQASTSGSFIPNLQASKDWIVTPTMKQQYASIFANLDKSNTGQLSPDQVASFLMTSKLGQQDLATIWDLSDIQNTGIFSLLEFSIALFLVNKKLAGEELPNIVPDSLISSLRDGQLPSYSSSVQSSKNVIPQPLEKQKTAMDDLVDIFGTSESSVTAPARPSAPQTRSSSSDLTSAPSTSKGLSTFKPTSSFGQSLLQNQPSPQKEIERMSAPKEIDEEPEPSARTVPVPVQKRELKQINYDALRAVPPPVAKRNNSSLDRPESSVESIPSSQSIAEKQKTPEAANGDLLADKEVSGQLSQATSDIANISNQIKSLTTQTTGLQDKKSKAESELSKILSVKKEIDAKLKQLRLSYQNEVKQAEQVEVNLASAKEETEALRSEASISEAKFHALTSELNEKQIALEDLQKENSSLKEKLGNMSVETIEINKDLENINEQHEKLKKQVSIRKSQVQASIAKSEQMKSKISELETALALLIEEDKNTQIQQNNLEEEHKKLSKRATELEGIKSDFSGKKASLGVGAAVGTAVAGGLGLLGTHSSEGDNNTSDLKATSDKPNLNVSALVDEVKEKPSADMTGVDDVNETSEGYDSKLPVDETKEKLLNSTVNENVNNPTAPSSVTSDYKASEGDTPVTSPSTSDFQFPQDNNAGIVGGMVGMPGVLVGVQRTDSLTSSVQNNAALSVRDDNIDDVGDQETLENGELSNPNKAITSSADTVRLGENFKVPDSSAAHQEDSSDGDKLSSGVESFEMVNADDARGHENRQSLQVENLEPEVSKPLSIDNKKLPALSVNLSSVNEEFPPIRELDANESSSFENDSQDEKFDDAVDSLPTASNLMFGSSEIRDKDVQTKTSVNDFDNAFDDLQPATREGAKAEADDIFDGNFDDLDIAKDERSNDDFENQEGYGFSDDFTNTPFEHLSARLNAPDFSQADSTSNNNDEWEQLFAGFGNGGASTVTQEPETQNNHQSQNIAIDELMGMGFDKETSLDALRKNDWNIEAATNFLLDNA